MRSRLPTVLSLPRNLDAMPPGGVEVFGSFVGQVPNDGAFHALSQPAGFPPLHVDPTYEIVVRFVRAEWQVQDLVIPPPLTLQLQVNGQASIALGTLADLTLLPLALGTPAFELEVLALVQAGASIAAQVKNTGTVAQTVDVYFTGWAYPMSLRDGDAYAHSARGGWLS